MDASEQVAASVDNMLARFYRENPGREAVLYLGEFEYRHLRRSRRGLESWRVISGQERFNGVAVYRVVSYNHLKVHHE